MPTLPLGSSSALARRVSRRSPPRRRPFFLGSEFNYRSPRAGTGAFCAAGAGCLARPAEAQRRQPEQSDTFVTDPSPRRTLSPRQLLPVREAAPYSSVPAPSSPRMSFFASGPASDDSDSDASLSSASSSTKAANKKPARTPGAARGMFATGDSSDSDSDDDSDSDSSSEEEEEMSSGDEDGPKKPAAGGKSKASAFLRGGDSDDSDADSDDEEKGAVKSAKDKREDEIDASLKKIENSSIKGNWIDISTGALSFLSAAGGREW